jgi:hypothetical protein
MSCVYMKAALLDSDAPCYQRILARLVALCSVMVQSWLLTDQLVCTVMLMLPLLS